MILFTVCHVGVGALTMAASGVLSIQILANVARPRQEQTPCLRPAGDHA
jgi:hypothetical protein